MEYFYHQADLQESRGFFLAKKRVKNEIRHIKDINVYSFNIDDQAQEIEVIFSIRPSTKKYTIVFDPTYPLSPPIKFFFEDNDYERMLRFPSDRFFKAFKEITGCDCFCLYSDISKDNWMITNTIDTMVFESKKVVATKKRMIEQVLANTIKTKYLIDDINLSQWI